MSRLTFGVCLTALVWLFSAPALAHHSFGAEFDANKPITLKGVVTKVEWTNPHARFYVDVKDEKGVVTNWNLELTSPNSVRRQGWGRNDLKTGDKVIFEGYAGKVVESRGSLARIAKLEAPDKPLFVQGGPESASQGYPQQ